MLVLPRVLGLVIALPLLTFIADVIGLAGGALLCQVCSTCRCSSSSAAQRGHRPITFWVGMFKAPVFAILIAIVGHLSRPAGARLVARAGAPDDGGRRAGHLPGAAGRRAVRGALMEIDF